MPPLPLRRLAPLLIGSALLAAPAAAHVARLPVEGKKLDLRGDAERPARNRLRFATDARQDALLVDHDPSADGFRVLVVGSSGAHSGLISLDPAAWKPIGSRDDPRGWKYRDRTRSRGGIGRVKLARGQLKIRARGPGWPFVPNGSDESIAVWVQLEDEWYCAEFGGSVRENRSGRFRAARAPAPGACGQAVCGNGAVEAGEQCDDGNLDDEDGCTRFCEPVACEGEGHPTTFDALQDVVLEGYGCTSALCHGQAGHASGLSLFPDDPDGNHARLVGAPATAIAGGTLVLPGDKQESFLYEKLAAATLGVDTTSSPMPVGGALSEEHLEAVGLWIEGGAPRDRVVLGTAERLASCLPPPDPLKIDPIDPPGPGEGVQFRSTAWLLPARSENEICFATFYDLGATDLIPPDQQVDCDEFGPNNPSGKCFRFHRKLLAQDPQSHHSIVYIYRGDFGPTDEPEPGRSWGPFTYKFDDPDYPSNGQPCDPTDVDPATGSHEGCSGPARSAVGCIGGVGPPDFSVGAFGLLPEGTGLEFHVSQEPRFDQEYADGVYQLLPMSGVLAWNSHAFNLTDADTTMAQYMNLWLAGEEDRLHRVVRIFAGDEIFTQLVAPFETAEYCHTWTAPRGARVIRLSSHTHRHGVRWRTWEPPNAPCEEDSVGSDTCGPGPDGQLVYFSSEYSDPVQLTPDPPWAFDTADPAERTFRFCALYDNGSTPDSPEVKRISTSPLPSGIPIGGPCAASQAVCLAGPSRGAPCDGDDRVCDSAPGAGDGACDACPLRGGVTTEDEMMVLLGDYYVVE